MPRKSKSPVAKTILKVSARDQLIFQQVSIQDRSQRDVAAEHRISQSQVSRIVRRVYRWICDTAPCGYEEVPRPQRLYGIARIYKEKLEFFEREAVEAWQQSKHESPWTRVQDVIEQPDGKTTLSPGKITRKSPKPDIKYLNAAKGYALALVEFEGFAKNGAVARDNNDRLHEVPEIPKEKERDVLIEAGQRLQANRDAERAEAARAQTNPDSDELTAARGTPEERTIRGMHEHGLEAPIFATPFTPPAPSLAPALPPPVVEDSLESPKTHFARKNTAPNDFDAGASNASSVAPRSPRCSHETSIGAVDINRNGESVPASAPHPIPLPEDSRGVPRVPGRGDQTNAPARTPAAVVPKAKYTPFIAPDAGRLYPDCRKAAAEERSRAQGVGRIFGTTSPGQGNIQRPEKSPDLEPPKKVYPPAPPGYVRLGDYCRPKQLMIMSDPVDCTKLRPFQNVTPPKYYVLNEKNTEWLAQW